jgi:hypothetical protein
MGCSFIVSLSLNEDLNFSSQEQLILREAAGDRIPANAPGKVRSRAGKERNLTNLWPHVSLLES